MHKNTGTGATADGLFTDGDADAGVPRSVLESAIMNTMLTELVNAVEGQGLVLDPNDDTQLLQALAVSANAATNLNAIINGGCAVAQRPIATLTDSEPRLGQVDRIFAQIATAAGAGTPQFSQEMCDWSSTKQCASVTGLDASTQTNTLDFIYRLESCDAARFFNKAGTWACMLFQDSGQLLDVTVSLHKANATDDFSSLALVDTSSVVTVPSGLASIVPFSSADLGACADGLQITVSIAIPAGVIDTTRYQISDMRLHEGSLMVPFGQLTYQLEIESARRFYENYLLGSYDTLDCNFVALSTTELVGYFRHDTPKRTADVAVSITAATDMEVMPGSHAVTSIAERGGNISEDGVKLSVITSGLTAGSQYTVRVKSGKLVIVEIESELYPYSVAAAPSAPSAPASITVPIGTDTDGDYTVSWDASSGALGYRLEQQKNGGSWSLQQDSSSTSKTYNNKSDGDYKYRVKAYNADGSSGYTTSTEFTVNKTPSAPASITVPGSDSDGNYTVSWASSSGATSYTLEEKKNSGSYSAIYTGGDTSRAISGRTDGTYTYRVKACNSSGCSGYRTSSSFVVNTPPDAPVLTASGGFKHYDASWTAESGADNYQLQQAIWSGSSYGTYTTVFSGSGLSYSRSVPTPTQIKLRVRAGEAGNYGDWSLEKVIFTT